ncbi:fumarylacetoacetate hydrolase family protein [Chachezhania antarctica]|uniref:fumarylacetoacetate hydrolase family protein n=1 Tax=Chachezhania antarctica TaxID=2340860 RepID=UPI000EB45A1A|nr:fumarylacetoacetate hydrolase family protein [Chachezhania antarctica]|tara:strand:+ start:848 stop:1690 length:843 start_codon:yes stop_codon:yes gene_type:complete
MKLLRYGPLGGERTGVLAPDGTVRDISVHVPELAGPAVAKHRLKALASVDIDSLPAVASPGRIGACLAWVPNFHCVGLNYTKHAHETGMPIPEEPILFSKATSALAGPNDTVALPADAQKGDWEVELGVVIGAEAENVSEEVALDYVAGYCVINDLSERAYQMERGGQWIKGKSLPGFGPIGPWFVTADEVPDPQVLGLSLDLNGERVQDSDTSDMIFSVRHIISHMSRFMRLVPGDIIATGTPSGVGLGMSPQRFLRDGDVMSLRIDGLGEQRQEVVQG